MVEKGWKRGLYCVSPLAPRMLSPARVHSIGEGGYFGGGPWDSTNIDLFQWISKACVAKVLATVCFSERHLGVHPREPSCKSSKYMVSWGPLESLVAAVYSNKCSMWYPFGRTTASCRSGLPSKIS